MPDYIKFPVVLVIVSVISAISLSYLRQVTEPARLAEAASVKKEALVKVLPSADDFRDKSAEIEGKPFDFVEGYKGGELVGYAATGSAYGYSSNIVVMVGVDKGFRIIAIKVISQKETPGLGDKVEEVHSRRTIVGMIKGEKYNEDDLRPWFQAQFDGKDAPLELKKGGGQGQDALTGATVAGKNNKIDAITGATISSRAVCEAVNQVVSNLKLAVGK